MHWQAITGIKNVLLETVLKEDSAHGHLYSKPESERSHRSYVLSRDPKAFPFGVSFVDKGIHHSSLFLHTETFTYPLHRNAEGKTFKIVNFFSR